MGLREERVAVLAGGDSPEAEVSRSSAGQVADALRARYRHVELIELDDGLTAALGDFAPAVVFPVLHGPPGEDGTVQGYLEMLGLPYVGTGVRGSALGMDKHVAKVLFRAAGLPVLEDVVLPPEMAIEEAVALVERRLGSRVAIKPTRQGSSLGITPLPNGGDLREPILAARRFGDPVLVEPFVLGRELTVGVLDLEGAAPVPWPVIETVTPSDEWYDFRNKYTAGRSEHIVPASLSADATRELQRIAVESHRALELRDLSRADFLVTDREEIHLLEVNTMPGMTPISLYPDGGRAGGYDFESLVDALVDSALRRGKA
ncbi:MAG: D-alanine--D-alanine ligase [Gammaproteobacteria bacterium]|nr:D-alanine--D-alanine ligase [Gammaproteobacteria bacterium]